MFDGAKVVRRVEGNLWVFGMVALEKRVLRNKCRLKIGFRRHFLFI